MSENKRYSDPISGIDYRWDDAKNKWVKSTGRDPWSDQLQPYLERQSRLTQESFGKYSLDNIRQNVSGMIEQNRSLNDQQRGLGVQLLNWVENLGFFSEDPDSPTSNFEATTMSEGGNEDLTQPRTWQKPEGQLSNEPSTGDLAMFDQPEKGKITDPKKKDQKDLKMKTWENPVYGDARDYDRTDPTQRRDRRLEDKLVEGRPLDKFKLNVERGNTTPVSELFHKAKK
jgi:hypothetical protein